jgi:hypothetical protein
MPGNWRCRRGVNEGEGLYLEGIMQRALAISLGLLAVACVKADVHRLDEAVRPARSPDSVTVLVAEPAWDYTVIAVVESQTDVLFKGFDDLRRRMVAEAAQLGGDALILGREGKRVRAGTHAVD